MPDVLVLEDARQLRERPREKREVFDRSAVARPPIAGEFRRERRHRVRRRRPNGVGDGRRGKKQLVSARVALSDKLMMYCRRD